MSVLWLQGHCPELSYLDDAELQRRAKLIRPCYLDGDALIYMVVPDLKRTAFTWDPQKLAPAKEWREVARIETHHRCGYIAFFKPSIDEVLCQISEHLLPQCNAFVTLSDDTVACYSEGDGHRTVTILYSAQRIDEEQHTYFDSEAAYIDYLFDQKRV